MTWEPPPLWFWCACFPDNFIAWELLTATSEAVSATASQLRKRRGSDASARSGGFPQLLASNPSVPVSLALNNTCSLVCQLASTATGTAGGLGVGV